MEPSRAFRGNLWLVWPTRAEQRPLAANWIGEYFASTGKVLFGRSVEGDPPTDCDKLWELDLSTGQETILLQGPCVEMASLSPDGRWLTYVENQRLWLRDLHGSTDHQIDTAYHPNIAWAPNSDALAYVDIDGRRILEVPSLSISQVYTHHRTTLQPVQSWVVIRRALDGTRSHTW